MNERKQKILISMNFSQNSHSFFSEHNFEGAQISIEKFFIVIY